MVPPASSPITDWQAADMSGGSGSFSTRPNTSTNDRRMQSASRARNASSRRGGGTQRAYPSSNNRSAAPTAPPAPTATPFRILIMPYSVSVDIVASI